MQTVSRKQLRGFTLIELLVVIAIIAILAAILFPVFAQAKEAAKKTACLSNTKQIAIGIYMYVADYDDTLPQTSWESSATPQPFNPGQYQIHWSYLIQPYVKNWNIFVCQSDQNVVTTDSACPNGVSDIGKLDSAGHMYCDWAAPKNSYIPIYNAMPAHDWNVVSLSVYSSPSSQIVVGEHRNDLIAADNHKGTSGFFPSQPCGTLVPYTGSAAKGTYSYFPTSVAKAEYALTGTAAQNKSLFKTYDILRVAWDRHSSAGGANYSFADGHAKYQNLGQTLDPNNYEYGSVFYPTPQAWGSCP